LPTTSSAFATRVTMPPGVNFLMLLPALQHKHAAQHQGWSEGVLNGHVVRRAEPRITGWCLPGYTILLSAL
jgi:hypothetical protein